MASSNDIREYVGHHPYKCAGGGEERGESETEKVYVRADGARFCPEHPPAGVSRAPAPAPTAPAPSTSLAPPPARTALQLSEIPEDVLEKRYNMSRAELEAVKKAIAPVGASDYDVMLYVGVCTRLKLDPFVPGLVHLAKFENRDKTGYRISIILGVYGYIALAQQAPHFDGFEVTCFPEDPNMAPVFATCTIHRKDWSKPLKVTVTTKEARARSKSPNWETSPRHMTENAAIRRAMRYAFPTLFGEVDEDHDPDSEDPLRGAAKGRVGTFPGEHHDTKPPITDAEFRPVEDPTPSASPTGGKAGEAEGAVSSPAAASGRSEVVAPPAPQPDGEADDPAVTERVHEIQAMLNTSNAETNGARKFYLPSLLKNAKLENLEDATTKDLKALDYVRDELANVGV